MLFASQSDRRSRAHGDAAGALSLAEDLARVDKGRWAQLLPTLREVAGAVAPRFADVMSPEDVLGELVLGSWDGWLGEWAVRVQRGAEHRSLHIFLRDRLRDLLREQRRKLQRRQLLLTPTGLGPFVETGHADQPIGSAMFSTEPPAPDADLSAAELRDAASGDAQARAVIALREAGFSQEEIARVLRVSRPTVTRRLMAIAAALLATFALIAFAWVVDDPEPDPDSISLGPEPGERDDSIPRESIPGGDDPTPVSPAPERPAAPGPAAEASPAQTPDTHGRVSVTSIAPCAIFIDGVARGLTPVRERVVAGEHVLEARREGYGVHRRRIVIGPGASARIHLGEDVWPAPTPPPARRPTPDPPDDDHRDTDRRTRSPRVAGIYQPPAPGEPYGTLTINTMPWCRVFVDGRDTRRNTPVRELRVSPGNHRIGLRTVEGVMHTVQVTVQAGNTDRIVRQL